MIRDPINHQNRMFACLKKSEEIQTGWNEEKMSDFWNSAGRKWAIKEKKLSTKDSGSTGNNPKDWQVGIHELKSILNNKRNSE